MFLLSLASGAFNLYSAFHTKSPQDLQRCIGSAGGAGGSVTANTNGVAGNVASNTNGVADAQGLDEKARTAVCEGANMVVKVITVAMYIAVWLVELCAYHPSLHILIPPYRPPQIPNSYRIPSEY